MNLISLGRSTAAHREGLSWLVSIVLREERRG